MSVRITLHLPGAHAASFHAVTFSYDPLPSTLAQVFVCAPTALVERLPPRALVSLREALRASPRRLHRADDRWTVLGTLPWGGPLYDDVVGALRSVQTRAQLVVIDPRDGDHGRRVSVEAPPPPMLFDDEDEASDTYEAQVESFLGGIVERYDARHARPEP